MPSRRDRLAALREQLENALAGDIPVRDFAALSREYRACLADIDDLPDEKKVSVADEIAKRRSARHAGATGKARSTRSS